MVDVTPEEVLALFDSVEGPMVTTADVVDILDCSPEVARTRLNELVERGLVTRRTSGQIVLWTRIETDQETDSPYLRGFGALAETDLPEEMKQERERARQEWARGSDRSS